MDTPTIPVHSDHAVTTKQCEDVKDEDLERNPDGRYTGVRERKMGRAIVYFFRHRHSGCTSIDYDTAYQAAVDRRIAVQQSKCDSAVEQLEAVTKSKLKSSARSKKITKVTTFSV